MATTTTMTQHPQQQNDEKDKSTWILPNNAVAESDYEAAVAAIQSTFEEAIKSMEDASKDNHEHCHHRHHLHDDSMDEATRILFQDAQASLLKNLSRIVNPVSDIEYEDYIDLYHAVQEDVDEVDNDCDDDELDNNSNNALKKSKLPNISQQEVPQPEIDEEDLLDTNALQEAKVLRESIRSLSRQIQESRERVLATSIQQTKQVTETVLARLGKTPLIESPPHPTNTSSSSTNVLQSALQDLAELFNDPQWAKLPHVMKSLQSTMDVIQTDCAEDRPMSQTELAIVSRTNSLDEEIENINQNDNDNIGDDISPLDRLAHFYQLFE